MLLKTYVKLCKKYNLISFDVWANEYDDSEEPDYGCVNGDEFITLVGFRKKANEDQWTKGSMIAYENGIYCDKYASNKKDAEKLIITLLKEQKNKTIKLRIEKINKDFV